MNVSESLIRVGLVTSDASPVNFATLVPNVSQLALAMRAEYYDRNAATPLLYCINKAGTGFTSVGAGGGGGSSTMAGLSDVTTYDLGTNNASVAAIKATANAALPAAQKAAASGVASLDAGIKIPSTQIPVPTLTTLGGVQSIAPVSHQFVTGINTSGVPSLAQPASGDISGLAASATTDTTNAGNISTGTLPAARLPNPSVSTLGGVQSIVAVSHQYVTSISNSGVPVLAQPVAADLSDLASVITTPLASKVTNVGTYATPAALQTAFPAAANGGNRALVGAGAPYSLYESDGSTWDVVTINNGAPLAISTATTLVNSHDAKTLTITANPAITINTGLQIGFGCSFYGAFTFAGTASVVDSRVANGVAFCSLVNNGTDQYLLVGGK